MTSFWIGIWEVPNSNLGQYTYKTEKVCVVYCCNSVHLPWQYVDQAIMRLPSKHVSFRHSVNILPWTLYRLGYWEIRETSHEETAVTVTLIQIATQNHYSVCFSVDITNKQNMSENKLIEHIYIYIHVRQSTSRMSCTVWLTSAGTWSQKHVYHSKRSENSCFTFHRRLPIPIYSLCTQEYTEEPFFSVTFHPS